jgi:hypothetical protein
MSYRFDYDPRSGLLQGSLEGRVTSEELLDYYRLAMKCARIKRPRSGITDMSGITSFEVSPQTVRELAAMTPVIPDMDLLRIIVAPASDVFGMARMFESQGEVTRPNLHVVRSYKEALVIVGVQDPRFEPIDLAELLDSDA